MAKRRLERPDFSDVDTQQPDTSQADAAINRTLVNLDALEPLIAEADRAKENMLNIADGIRQLVGVAVGILQQHAARPDDPNPPGVSARNQAMKLLIAAVNANPQSRPLAEIVGSFFPS